MIKKLKTFFCNNLNKIVTITIFNKNIYFACLICHDNIWSIKNISQTSWDNFSADFPSDWLYQTVLINHCQNIPVSICLPEDFFSINQSTFPQMTSNELKKSISWDIRSKNASDNNTYGYGYTCTTTGNSYLVNIYAMPLADIFIWKKRAHSAHLILYSIYPQQYISYIHSENKTITINFNNINCVISLPLDNTENLPDYILSVTQPLLLTNTNLNLLPDRYRPSILSIKKLIITAASVAAAITCSILLFYQIKLSDLNSALEKQSLMLSSLKNISLQKTLINKYQENIQQRQNILLKLNPHKKSYYAVLANLGAVNNNSTIITAIDTDNDTNILITGTANEYSQLQKYLDNLKGTYFPDIILLSAEKQTTDNIKFILKLPHQR